MRGLVGVLRLLFGGYKGFVALRYLMVDPPRVGRRNFVILLVGAILQVVAVLTGIYHGGHSLDVPMAIAAVCCAATWVHWLVCVLRHCKLGLIVYLVTLVLFGLGGLALALESTNHVPLVTITPEMLPAVMQTTSIVVGIIAVINCLAGFAGTIRAFFTFFTTVPIVGVFIGTFALVTVLSVMSGFEADLREKILGSNAHIQITREEGEFTDWHAVEARIDREPGVMASTPYAVSEVVVAANSNGMNVIIKGIDPKTVGHVTELVHDLDDKDAMARLAPLVNDTRELRVLPAPADGSGASGSAVPVRDPAPADMPHGGDPIDFSQPDDPPRPGDSAQPGGEGDARAGAGAAQHVPIIDVEPPLHTPKQIDPPPADLVTTDAEPIDFSHPDSAADADPVIHIEDLSDSPAMSRRTQSLPGILVGRELVKQTHLYTGEEVSVVSPLSDPSNPDATGTPIPFNRDYRVAGTFYTGMYEYDLKYVYVSLDSLDEFLDRGDSIDGIEVRVDDPDDTDIYVAQLKEHLGPEYRVQDWKELNRSLFSALKLEKIAMFLVLGLVILVASFAIVGNLVMVVVEKQKEIALLKTLGASDLGLLQLFAIQGLLIGLLGTLLGVGIGLVFCSLGERYGIPLDPDVYYIDKMPVHVESISVLLTALAGVLISVAATIYPSVLAARVRPAAGMRQ